MRLFLSLLMYGQSFKILVLYFSIRRIISSFSLDIIFHPRLSIFDIC